MSRCEKHIGERALAVVPAFDALSGPAELAVIRITGVTAIGNQETIRTKAKLAGTLLFGRIKGSGRSSGVAVSRRCTVQLKYSNISPKFIIFLCFHSLKQCVMYPKHIF